MVQMTNVQQTLNQLAQLLHSYCLDNYDSAHLEYAHNPDGSWNSFSAWYVIAGKNVAPVQFSELKVKAEKLCKNLYQFSLSEKNSDWRKVELSISNGRAKINFDYSAQDQ